MINIQVMEFDKLIKEFIKELRICGKFKYTGELNINNNQGRKWKFYYQCGQVIWATGGIHPHRRLRRNLVQYYPEIDLNNGQFFSENVSIDYWDYLTLQKLHHHQQISEDHIVSIVSNTISEILFDIFQNLNSSSFTFDKTQGMTIESSFTSVDINIIISQVQKSFEEWQEAGIEKIYPDLAPILQQPAQLQQQVSPLVYQNFQRLINGKNTFSELAVKMKKSALQIIRSLQPYIQKNIISLIEVPDLPLPTNNANKLPAFATAQNTNAPLIACIDDSPQICAMLEKIITAHGMRFIGIQHPLQALPLLIENKPDLIFLDLIMPVMSGYEVCEQLRRCSVFKKTPVVILTGSDGVFDRVRSKVFGATEFINKPVETTKIIGVVNKYLQPKYQTNKGSKLAFSY